MCTIKTKAGRVLFAMLAFAAAICSSTTAQAEVAVESEEVVVSATRTEIDIQEAPVSISVVGKKEIQRSGSSTVGEMLRDVPGVELSDSGGGALKRVYIRGENGFRVLVLVDGQKITEQKSMSGTPILIDPSNIERIEVIKGPASVLFGSEAIGGAINIITKKGGGKPIGGSLTANYNGATDGLQETVAVYGGFDNGLSYRLSGQYSDQDNWRAQSGTLKGTSSLMRNFGGFLGYDTETLSVGVRVEDYWSNIKGRSNPTTITDLPEWTRRKGALFFDLKDLTEYLPKIHGDIFYQTSKKEFINDFKIAMGPPPFGITFLGETENTQDTYGLNIQADFTPSENHYLIAGYSYTLEKLKADDYKYYRRALPGPPPTVTITDYNYKADQTTHALFLQDEWTLPEDFTATFGVRYTWASSKLASSDDPTAHDDTVSDSAPVFSIGLTWMGVEDLTLRALFSQGYRFPTLTNSLIPTGMMGTIILPTPDLKPETSNNYELGARYNGGMWNIDATAFMSETKDYITSEATTTPRRYVWNNVNKATTYGLELHAEYTFADVYLTPYVTGTWLRRKFQYDDFSTWRTGRPELSARYGLKFERDFTDYPSTLWADVYMRSATDSTSESSNGTITEDDSWSTLNLGVGAELGKDRQYTVSLNVNNITNERYTPAYDAYEAPGPHVVFNVGVRF